jgi:hypothetical protein
VETDANEADGKPGSLQDDGASESPLTNQLGRLYGTVIGFIGLVLMLVFLDRGNASSMIIKSPTDPRTYSSVELPNNLRVLLVSHPKTERATAAASMGSGSFNEGWETRGLAHFCEHMLFLGNAKYPIEGDYSKYCHRVWVV